MSDWVTRQDFAGRRVTVMGLGAFGGQIGAARFLVGRGARVLVTDVKDASGLGPALAALEGLPIRYRLGEHRVEDFEQTDMVLASPAVSPRSPHLQAARDAGALVESEMNLFFRYCPAPIVGVTGTNGKSTTTHMIGEMAGRHEPRRSWVGGNIGGSVLEIVDQVGPGDLVVLELSSYQLEALDALGRSPRVAVVTNFAANHLDHHADMDEYRWAKQTILRHQRPGDVAVLNRDDEDVAAWRECTAGETLWFSLDGPVDRGAFVDGPQLVCRFEGREDMVFARDDLRLPGRHNAANALAALLAAGAAGVAASAMAGGLRSCRALEHRLEFVCEREGVRYYNDSKATTPAAGIIGVQAFSEPAGRLIVIAGGYDKHVPLEDYAQACVEHAKHVVVLGEVREELRQLIAGQRGEGTAPGLTVANTFEDAVREAQRAAAPGDVVLLSPACASYGMFANYEERGRRFRELASQ